MDYNVPRVTAQPFINGAARGEENSPHATSEEAPAINAGEVEAPGGESPPPSDEPTITITRRAYDEAMQSLQTAAARMERDRLVIKAMGDELVRRKDDLNELLALAVRLSRSRNHNHLAYQAAKQAMTFGMRYIWAVLRKRAMRHEWILGPMIEYVEDDQLNELAARNSQ